MVNSTQKNLSPEDIAKLTDTYHAWREGKGYERKVNANLEGMGYGQ